MITKNILSFLKDQKNDMLSFKGDVVQPIYTYN